MVHGSSGHSKTYAKGDELSVLFQVVSGIVIVLFFLLGLAGNINVFLVCLQQQIRIHRVTKWILLNLAVFDLISCLVNCPAIFLVVVV